MSSDILIRLSTLETQLVHTHEKVSFFELVALFPNVPN
ncbi:unnamed protein product [Haemonchus placei]|uniref:NR LBD domain-containing protein n=1 Tax=Haemonchus placei TaxID=6290 RepID=A0A0N4WZX2_HAEPC|nr:unnamed protein product [Haemonchus placei]